MSSTAFGFDSPRTKEFNRSTRKYIAEDDPVSQLLERSSLEDASDVEVPWKASSCQEFLQTFSHAFHNPKQFCQHSEEVTRNEGLRNTKGSCSVGFPDLWLCLHCCFIGCGKKKRQHALEHFKQANDNATNGRYQDRPVVQASTSQSLQIRAALRSSFEQTHAVTMKIQTGELWCYSCKKWVGQIDEIESQLAKVFTSDLMYLASDQDKSKLDAQFLMQKRRKEERLWYKKWINPKTIFRQSDYYVISKKWIRQWEDFLRGDCDPPGMIMTSHLVRLDESEYKKLAAASCLGTQLVSSESPKTNSASPQLSEKLGVQSLQPSASASCHEHGPSSTTSVSSQTERSSSCLSSNSTASALQSEANSQNTDGKHPSTTSTGSWWQTLWNPFRRKLYCFQQDEVYNAVPIPKQMWKQLTAVYAFDIAIPARALETASREALERQHQQRQRRY